MKSLSMYFTFNLKLSNIYARITKINGNAKYLLKKIKDMGCGCKKKTQVPPPQVARPVPAPPSRITLKENPLPRPPQPIPPAQQRNVNEIVEKLAQIQR